MDKMNIPEYFLHSVNTNEKEQSYFYICLRDRQYFYINYRRKNREFFFFPNHYSGVVLNVKSLLTLLHFNRVLYLVANACISG